MFLSKLWFFLISVAAGIAITIALVMPRPAERAATTQENKRVRTACVLTKILQQADARDRIQLASEFAQALRHLRVGDTLFEASKGEIVSGQANATARTELNKVLSDVQGDKPTFVWLLDRKGRVVVRSDDNANYGDSMRGYFAVQDALDGYVRDGLWSMDSGLVRVGVAPVFTQQISMGGVIVLAQAVDQKFATTLGENVEANVNFYSAGHPVATSNPVQIHKDVTAGSAALSGIEVGQDCQASEILDVKGGQQRFAVVNARLPGEAGEAGAFYSVFIKQAPGKGFMGTLKAADKNDLGFDKFPWIQVIIMFLLIMIVGFVLMFWEVDGPIKRLSKEAVALAQGDVERFTEDKHRSKYGSVARSVNIAIDKMVRETKAAKKDFDQLLGPAPTSDGASSEASSLPPIGPGGDTSGLTAPPPSEFKFGGADSLALAPPPATPDLAPPPPNKPDKSSLPPIPTNKKTLEPDSLAEETKLFNGPRANTDDEATMAALPSKPAEDSEAEYFKSIFQDFITLKKKCGESVDSLTFERFSKKLEKNQAALMTKHSCKSVKFQVYEKDGKAALKASPVK